MLPVVVLDHSWRIVATQSASSLVYMAEELDGTWLPAAIVAALAPSCADGLGQRSA
jgi:hypothetical protein